MVATMVVTTAVKMAESWASNSVGWWEARTVARMGGRSAADLEWLTVEMLGNLRAASSVSRMVEYWEHLMVASTGYRKVGWWEA